MSDFEYSSKVMIGQYLPLDSPLHRLDPRARILIFFLLLCGITFAQHLSGLMIGLAAVLIGLLAASIPLKYALRGLIPPLPFLLVLAVIQIALNSSLYVSQILLQVGPVRVTQAGLLSGAVLLLRFSGLVLSFSLSSFCLSTSQMIHGLQSLLRPLRIVRFPARDLIMIIQVMLRFLPLLAQVAERIAKAQASRGAEWGRGQGNLIQRARQVIPLIVPLFITSLHKAENLALAMDARAYGSVEEPTSMDEMLFRWTDWLAVAICLAVSAAVLFI
jgi:energy-coupling factor transport system permease protein